MDFGAYPCGKKGWKVYDMETHEILVSRDVVFHKTVFPFLKKIPGLNRPHITTLQPLAQFFLILQAHMALLSYYKHPLPLDTGRNNEANIGPKEVFHQWGATVKDNELEESTRLAPRNVREKRPVDRPASCGSPASSKTTTTTIVGLLDSGQLAGSDELDTANEPQSSSGPISSHNRGSP